MTHRIRLLEDWEAPDETQHKKGDWVEVGKSTANTLIITGTGTRLVEQPKKKGKRAKGKK